MNWDWIRFWDFTAADWAGLQFAVLLAAAAFAFFQVREAQRLRVERSRPFVVLDVVVEGNIGLFRIRNIGATLARDVRFEFDPPIRSTLDHAGGKRIADLNVFAKGIPSLSPGQEVTGVFDQLAARNATDLPDDYDVSVAYSDPLGNPHAERMVAGISHRRDMLHLHRHDIHDVHKRLEEISKTLKAWTHSEGLKVLTPEDRSRYREELEAHYAEPEQES